MAAREGTCWVRSEELPRVSEPRWTRVSEGWPRREGLQMVGNGGVRSGAHALCQEQ